MNKKIRLYIGSQDGSDTLTELDLYGDEPVKIVDSIQDVKDVSKIFTVFSRDFKVPASPANTITFKHFYNSDIDDGFDGRIKTKALIQSGGADYKNGYLRFIKAIKTNGSVSSYQVSFQGSVVTLADTLGKAKLKDLDYTALLHENTNDTIMEGIRDGLFLGEANLPQVTEMIVALAPSVDTGSCRVSLNGVLSTIAITSDSSNTLNAIELAAGITASGTHTATSSGNKVTVVSLSYGVEANTEFLANTAYGMSVSVETIQVGSNEGDNGRSNDGLSAELYPDIIYAPIFTEFKAVAVPFGLDWSAVGNVGINESPDDNTYDFSLTKFTGVGTANVSVPIDEDTPVSTTQHMSDPVAATDYKPSLKMGRLIKMIAHQYGLNIDRSFYELEELDQLYIFFNGKREKTDVPNSDVAFNYNASSSSTLEVFDDNSTIYTTESPAPTGSTTFDITGSYDNYTCLTGNYQEMNESKSTFSVTTHTSPSTVYGSRRRYFYDEFENKVYVSRWEGTVMNANQNQILSKNLLPNITESFYENNMVGRDIYWEHVVTSDTSISGGFEFIFTSRNCIGFLTTPEELPFFDTASVGNTVTVSTTAYIALSEQAPDIELIKVLTGVFKLLNMTAFIDSDNNVQIQPLAKFYGEGNVIDITSSIDTSTEIVSPGLNHRNILMNHQDPEDVMTKHYSGPKAGVNFGDIRLDREDFIPELAQENLADGKDYVIKSPFNVMMYENLSLGFTDDQSSTEGIYSAAQDGLPTDIVIGNCIDDKLEEVQTKPIIFYAKQVDISKSYSSSVGNPTAISQIAGRIITTPSSYTEHGNSAGIYGSTAVGRSLILSNGVSNSSSNLLGLATADPFMSSDGVTDISALFKTQWWNPSNIMASRYRRDGTTFMNANEKFSSIAFNNDVFDEFEYHSGYASENWINGLYQSNYEEYFNDIYSKKARIVKFNVNFSQALISTYGLNDVFIAHGKEYNINKIEIDILTGKGSVELINKLNLSVVA
jgi:hypothetical protein